MTQNSGEEPTIKSGLYWRQSLWNARKCVPVILATDGERLWMTSQEGVAFSAPCTEVEAKFSGLSTLTITTGGTKYALVGKPANLSPRFDQAQLDELAQSEQLASSAGNFSGTSLAMLGPIVAGAGVFFDMRNMAKNIKPWKSILPEVGVSVR